MPEILVPRDARRVLRQEISAMALLAFFSGYPLDGSQWLDGTLRWSLILIALAIARAVFREEYSSYVSFLQRQSSGLDRMLRRLPVDSTTALHARLQMALALGALVLAALGSVAVLTEITMRPASPTGELFLEEVLPRAGGDAFPSPGVLVDLVIGFLGLLAFLICVLHSINLPILWGASLPIVGWLLFVQGFGHIDVENGITPAVASIWARQPALDRLRPLLILIACGTAYFFGTRPPNSCSSGSATLASYWHGGFRRRMELLATAVLLLMTFVFFFGSSMLDLKGLGRMVWLPAIMAVQLAVSFTLQSWALRDPLLSRLPVHPATVARRRLTRMVIFLTLLALLALLVQHLGALESPPTKGTPHSPWIPRVWGWATFLLVLASGHLAMTFALLGRSRNGAGLGAALGAFICCPAMFMAYLFGAPVHLAVLCSVVVACGLPTIYLLMSRHVALGRAPGFPDLVAWRQHDG